jgi:hypothetical protein
MSGISERVESLARDVRWDARARAASPSGRSRSAGLAPPGSAELTAWLAAGASRSYVNGLLAHRDSLTPDQRAELTAIEAQGAAQMRGREDEYRDAFYRSLDGSLEDRSVMLDDEVRFDIPESWGHVDLDRLRLASVSAYAVRWGVDIPAETADGSLCYVRYRNDAFDESLFESRVSPAVDLLVNHGWGARRHDARGGVRNPVGQVVHVAGDDIGLRVYAIYDGTRDGLDALAKMESGEYPAYSAHCEVGESEQIGERDGLPVYEITRARLVECGPTDDPADPGAHVIAMGGVPAAALDGSAGVNR